MDGEIVILEDTTTFRIEMFYHHLQQLCIDLQ